MILFLIYFYFFRKRFDWCTKPFEEASSINCMFFILYDSLKKKFKMTPYYAFKRRF